MSVGGLAGLRWKRDDAGQVSHLMARLATPVLQVLQGHLAGKQLLRQGALVPGEAVSAPSR